MILEDPNKPSIDSEIIVSIAKRALNNLPYYEERRAYFGTSLQLFREEFGTVKISMPRQSGHSTAALQLMYEYPDSLLFLHSISAKELTRGLLREYIDDPKVFKRIEQAMYIPGSMGVTSIRPVRERPFIIFDQTTTMRRNAIASVLTAVNAKIIVELG